MRPASHAGSWYSNDKNELEKQMAFWFSKVKKRSDACYIVAPHAGFVYSGQTAAHSFGCLPSDAKRVFILGPDHCGVRGARVLNVSRFESVETPLGTLRVDTAACAQLAANESLVRFLSEEEDVEEHCVEMMLPFVAHVTECGAAVVPIIVRESPEVMLANAAAHLRSVMVDGDFLVVSSDFCHYGLQFGYVPTFKHDMPHVGIRQLDEVAVQKMGHGAHTFNTYLRETGNTICGCNAITICLSVFPPPVVRAELLHYTQSGRAVSPRDMTVSYAAVAGVK